MRRLILPLFLGVFFFEVPFSRGGGAADRDFTINVNVSPNVDSDVLINNEDPNNRVITVNMKDVPPESNESIDEDKKSVNQTVENDEPEVADDQIMISGRRDRYMERSEVVHVPNMGQGMGRVFGEMFPGKGQRGRRPGRMKQPKQPNPNQPKQMIIQNMDGLQGLTWPVDQAQVIGSTAVSGLYTLAVGYHLKENILNVIGYVMYQPLVNINRRLFIDFSNLKTSIQLDDVDVFRIIPYLPDIVERSISDQFQMILDFLVENLNTCKENCINARWRANNFDVNSIFSHWTYNPIFNGIIDVKKGRSQQALQNLAAKLKNFPSVPNAGYAALIFSPAIVEILQNIQQNTECLSEELLGYLLTFYPFPLHDKEVDMAINQITLKFLDDFDDTPYCKLFFHHYNHLAMKPVELLKAISDRILESFCPSYLKAPAKIIRRALEEKLTIANYRNTLTNKFVSMTDLGKLLNQIDLTNFPVEIIMAKERVKDFIAKVLPYIDYQEFAAYKFHNKEEALMAFLIFLQVKTPHAHLSIRASINAIKSHFQFSNGPKLLTPELLVTLADAWLAPDLSEEIIEEAYGLKLFILDEGSEIRRILSRQQRKCHDVMQCFIKATTVLRNDEAFSRRSFNLKIPQCVMYRYLNYPTSNSVGSKTNLMSLLDVITPQMYRREIILAATRLRDFISDGKDLVPGFNGERYCTKQEALVAYLEQATKNTNFPREIYDSMRALIPSVAFKIRQIRQVNVRVVHEISKAFLAPDNDEVAMHQMVNVANFMSANEVVIDLILDKLNPVKCNDVLRCYNQIADVLNRQNFTTFVFPKFRGFSPELYVLNLGFDTSQMSVEKITRIVQALTENSPQDNNELDAAVLYASLTAHLIDPYLNTVSCNDKQVMPCFENLLHLLKQHQHNLDVKVSVYQYILTPTTCDRRYCHWISYYEQGTTVLNPVLEYVKFLTEMYMKNVQHFHLHLEMRNLLEYLAITDVDTALNGFKVRLLGSDQERFVAFLSLVSKSLSLEDPMSNNLQNIINYFTANASPKYFTLDNLKWMVKYLEGSTPEAIHCDMKNKLSSLLADGDKVAKLFKPIEVDCSSLQSCLITLEGYILASIWLPYAGIVLEIIRPDECYEQQCQWTKGRFPVNPKSFRTIKEKLLVTLQNLMRAPDTEVPIIIKLLADVLIRDNRLSYLLHFIQPEDIQYVLRESEHTDILSLCLDVVLSKYNPPPDISPSLKHLFNYLKHNTLPVNLNHETLINLLMRLNRETRDDVVRTQINILQDLIMQKMAIINAELPKLEIPCVTLDQCLRKLYEKTQNMNNNKLQRFLHQILLSPGCPLAHCPRKISVSKQAADNFIKFILERFEALKDALGCTYHLALDIDFVKNVVAAHGTEIVTSHLLYKRKEPNIVLVVLNAILNQEHIPKELALSVSNILNFFNLNLAPTYIHIYHLNHIANQLQAQAQDENVKKKFATIIENLEVRAPEINLLLLQMPVNCTTFKSCLVSLYLRLLKDNKTGMVQYLIEMFAPIGCNDVICPWLMEFPAKHVEQVKYEILNQISTFDFMGLSFQLRSDIDMLRHIIATEALDDIYGILDVQGNINLGPFLEALGTNILIKYDAQESEKNVINYITKGILPNKLGLNGLKSLSEMFYNLTTDNLIKNDIQEAMNDLAIYNANVKTFLHKLVLNCTDLSMCIEGIYDSLQIYKNDPMSVIVKNLLFPHSCTKITCPWILEESIEISLEKLRNIKHAISQLVDSDTLPLIINIELDNIKSMLKLENTKELLPRVDVRKQTFLLDFLKQMYLAPNIYEDDRAELTNLIAYFTNGTLPDKLTLRNYQGLVKTIKRLSDDILVVYELIQLEKKAERYPKVLENILSNCPVECVKLPTCINSLKDCLIQIKSPYAKIMLEQICPLKSQDEKCSKVDYSKRSLIFPGKLFYPNQLIFFVSIDNTLQYITLDLTDQSTLLQLSGLPPIETFSSQIAMLEFRDATGVNRRITIDLNNKLVLEKILGMNPKSKPTIDFSSAGSTVVYVPIENGKLVPIKIDQSLPIVREGLKQLVRLQLHNGINPEIIIIDFDGTQNVLSIDVNNNALWKSLLKISSDSVHIDSPFLLMFPGKYGNSWRSVIVTDYDRHAINTLQNLPTFDEVNTVQPVLGVTGGLVQLCFNVFDSWVASTLKNMNKMSRVPTIQTRDTQSLLLGVPDRMGNLVPLRVNLNDSRFVEALVKTSQQLACTTGCQPTFILQTDSESIPLHLNFDNPLALYILLEELRSVDKMEVGGHTKIIIVQDNHSKEFIILIPDNHLVAEWLEDLSKIPDRSGDRITIRTEDGSYEIQVAINRDNPLVMQYLKQLMEKTLVPIPPTEVTADDGRRYLAMTVIHQVTGKLIPVVIELNPHNINLLKGISQPYNTAAFEINIDRSVTIRLEPNDQNLLEILPMLQQGDMMGIATETPDDVNNGDVVSIPIIRDGKYEILFFETRKPHVYETLKETCNDTSKVGRSIVLTRPSDGQMEVIYCDLTKAKEQRLKRHAGRIKEKLPAESTVIMTIPDKTGMLHPFILDLRNPEILRRLRYFTSIANPASENKIAVDYTDIDEHTEIFVIDLNEVSIEEIQTLSYFTPRNMVPMQKSFNGYKLLIATYPMESPDKVGSLILNLTDPRTQEILSSISDPANPMATKIGIDTAFGKIDVFIDFDDVKHLTDFNELSQIAPLIPAPLLIKRSHGLLKFNFIDQYGRPQTVVLNVTDPNVLESLGINPNKPKLSIIDSEGHLRVITVDPEDQQRPTIGSIIYKPDKNTFVMIGIENEHPIILDLTQPEIRELLKSVDTGNPSYTPIILPSLIDRRMPIYVNLQDKRTQMILREAQLLNSPNLRPLIIPTYDSNHNFIVFTIQVDDKKTRPIIIDNQDFSTIKSLIEVSDKSNPSSRLITITDSNGMTYPLYLDLTDMNIQQILTDASNKVHLPNEILMNTDDKIDRYLELPLGGNRFTRCDITNPVILNRLIQISNANQQKANGVSLSIVNPVTRESVILSIDLNTPEAVMIITELCEKQIFVQPNPTSTLVVYVKIDGTTRPIILNLESESIQELLQNLNQVQPGKEGNLVQYVDRDGNLQVYRIDFHSNLTQQTLKQYHESHLTSISPTVVNTGAEYQALVMTVIDDKNEVIPLYISLDNSKVFSILKSMSNHQDMNATPIMVTDLNGFRQVFYINLNDKTNVATLVQLSWESSTDKDVTPVLPITRADKETTVAVLDSKGRVVIFTLDLTNPWVLQTVSDLSVTNTDRPTVSIAVPTENGTKFLKLDVTNDKIISMLETVSSKQEFKSNPGDLIILPNINDKYPIILDIANDGVVQTLLEISHATAITNSTHMFVITDKDGNSQLITLNLQDIKVQAILHNLSKQIPNNLKPTQITGPDQKTFSAFTFVDSNKQFHSFVLDVTSEEVRSILMRVANPHPMRPFDISFTDQMGKLHSIILDSANEMFLQILELAQEKSLIPSVPLKNINTDALENKLLIPVVQENGNVLQYTFDLSNPNTVNKLILLSTIAPGVPAITIYLQDQRGSTYPIRLDVTNPNVLENLQLIAEDISAAYTFRTALIFVVTDNGKKDVIILDKDDKQMVDTFITSFPHNYILPTTNCTILNLIDDDGNTIEIKLDLYDSRTVQILKGLQNKYTPKVIKPFVVKLPNFQLPLIVFSFKNNGVPLSIALDTNNPDVLNQLRMLHTTITRGKYFLVPLPGPTPEEISINIEDPGTIEKLILLSQITNVQETPLLLPSSDFVFTILDSDNKLVRIQLDTRDQLVLQELIDISKQAPPNSNCYVALITDSYGSTIPIRIDTSNSNVVMQLINLARRFIYPKRYRVIPKTGYVPLQVFDIPINTFSFPITIDCNNGTVLNMINQQVNSLKPGSILVKIMACEQKGVPPILIDMEDKNLPMFLTGITVLSSVILNPIVIITKPGNQPLLNMLVEVDYGQAAITLDLNDLVVVKRLLELQPQTKIDVTTFFYEVEGKKHALYLDLKDQLTLNTLKEITLRAPIRLIPVIYKQPKLVIDIRDEDDHPVMPRKKRSVIELDLSNPQVTSALEQIGSKHPPQTSVMDLVYVEIPGKYNLPCLVYFDLSDSVTLTKLRQLSTYTPPAIPLVLPNRRHKVVLPNSIVHGPVTEFPIAIFFIVDFGPVCIDLNIEQVRFSSMQFTHGFEPDNPTYVMIPHVSGDTHILRLDLFDVNTLTVLKNITSYCQVYYEPLEELGPYILAITLPKKVIHLDLNRTDVLDAMKELSFTTKSDKMYSVYLESSPGTYKMFNIDIYDVKTQEILYNLEKPKLPPFLFELKYQDLDMSVWKIVIDVNSYDIMDELMLFSDNTMKVSRGDASQIISLKLMSPQGRQFDLKLDKTNPSTLQILKSMTVRSANAEPELLIKPKPKNIQYIEIVDQSGSSHQIAIDVNNLSVLRKLQQIVDSQDNGPKIAISIKMPDGSSRQIQIDVTDTATIENLMKLSIESERGIPAQLVRIRPPKRVIPILMSFPITAPFVGSFSVTVDVGKTEIVDRLRALAAEFVPGRSEFELNLRDRNGQEIVLKLDLTNSTTLYKLVMLTIDSTGHNPTGIDPIEILHHVIYVPDLITVEIPDGYEVLPISFDRSSPQVIELLRSLPTDMTGHSSSWELLDHKNPVSITIDSTTVRSQTAMRSVGIQTVLPYNSAEKSSFYGLFFLRTLNGITPVLLDLSKREVVIAILKLVKSLPRTANDVYFEVRDDFSQYVTVGLDLANPFCVQTILPLGMTVSPLSIDARRLPYLEVCLPVQASYRCIKMKLKLATLDQLGKLPEGNGAVPLQILDGYGNNREVYINPQGTSLFDVLSVVDSAATILPPLTINVLVIYASEMDEVTPIYVDLTSPKVIDLLNEMDGSYNGRQPLAIITYSKEDQRHYFLLSLDAHLISSLSQDTAIVGGHSIIKQKAWQKTTINVPSSDGTNISIVLDMADKEVVASLKELSRNFDGSMTPTLINLEDAYGFPFQIKLNIYDEKTIGHLIKLSNKQKIV